MTLLKAAYPEMEYDAVLIQYRLAHCDWAYMGNPTGVFFFIFIYKKEPYQEPWTKKPQYEHSRRRWSNIYASLENKTKQKKKKKKKKHTRVISKKIQVICVISIVNSKQQCRNGGGVEVTYILAEIKKR